MHLSLLDRVIERSETHIVTVKGVSSAEDYLQDHFPDFPVLPGVFMIEAMVAAARELVGEPRLVLGSVRAVKYGRFVRPGETLVVRVSLLKRDGASVEFKGEAGVRGANGAMIEGATAVSGRFVLRPLTV